jgi:hypothetical protein
VFSSSKVCENNFAKLNYFLFFSNLWVTFSPFSGLVSRCVFFKFNELKFFEMKNSIFNNGKTNFETLSTEEMLKVRGGSKPINRPIDILLPPKR